MHSWYTYSLNVLNFISFKMSAFCQLVNGEGYMLPGGFGFGVSTFVPKEV